MSRTLPSINETAVSYPGWRVLFAAVIGLAFSPGPMIFGSLGLFAPSLQQSFGWARGEIMLGLTFFNVAGVLASPYTGALIDRLGVRRVLFPAMLFFVSGFLGLAWLVGSLPAFYALAFVWGGLTIGTQSISYTKLITGWFVHHRGLAIGIAAAGLGLGYSLVPMIAARLLAETDWRGAMVALAGLIVAVPLLINLLLARPNPAQALAAAADLDGLTRAEAVRTREFRLMAWIIFMASAALTGVVPHISLLALDRGFATGQAALVASTYGISTVLGRVLVGWLADHFPVERVAMAFFLTSAVGFACAAMLNTDASLGVLILVALTIGLGFGAESDVIALFISRHFGQRAFAGIYGYLLAAFLIGASVGPPLLGYGRDIAGNYVIPMIAATAVMLVSCLLLEVLARCPARTAAT